MSIIHISLSYRYQSWHPLQPDVERHPSLPDILYIIYCIACITNPVYIQSRNKMSETQPKPSSTSPWVILAVTSGTFAALNGVFAKLYVKYTRDTIELQLYMHIWGYIWFREYPWLTPDAVYHSQANLGTNVQNHGPTHNFIRAVNRTYLRSGIIAFYRDAC